MKSEGKIHHPGAEFGVYTREFFILNFLIA